VAIAGNINHVEVPERRVLYVEPSKGTKRTDGFIGLQEAFIDYHIGRYDTSRFDFVSLRAGIQPFQSDFRGFLFNDNQLGVRLFGNRDNNRVQFNVAAFWRIEKETNSGLNNIAAPLRKDWILTANLYRQDFPVIGLTSQLSATYNINRERRITTDANGFPVRPALLGDLRPHLQRALPRLRGGRAHRPSQPDGSGLRRLRPRPEQLPHQRARQDPRLLWCSGAQL